MPIFAESINLVRAVEAHLVSETNSNIPLFSYLKRLIWLPAKFLKMGVSEKTKGASVWAFLSFAFIMLGAWFINNSGIAKTEAANIVMLAAMIIPMFLVTFAMPSMYGDSGVTQNTIRFTVSFLQARGFTNTKDIELLKKSVKLFEDRARSRVNVLKWLVGLLWAGFMFTFSKGFEQSMASPAELMSYAFMSASLLMLVIAAYLCVWGYDAALDKLFRAIEFGCNDLCHFVELPAPNEG
ncbi:MAG: hypothetical protein ACYCZC_08010 [Acidithiobacillus sp.]